MGEYKFIPKICFKNRFANKDRFLITRFNVWTPKCSWADLETQLEGRKVFVETMQQGLLIYAPDAIDDTVLDAVKPAYNRETVFLASDIDQKGALKVLSSCSSNAYLIMPDEVSCYYSVKSKMGSGQILIHAQQIKLVSYSDMN